MSMQTNTALRRDKLATPVRPGHSFRLPANAGAVLDVLRQSEQPLKAYTMLERLHEHGIYAPMSVYRALTQLIERGLVKKIESLNAFIALPDIPDVAVAFVICRSCGKAQTEVIDQEGQSWLRRSGFGAGDTYIERYRECLGC